jgi:DNA-binding transcriptional regulator YiaG
MDRNKKVRDIRKAEGLTQTQFAHVLTQSTPPTTISRWERGDAPVSDVYWELIQLKFPKHFKKK